MEAGEGTVTFDARHIEARRHPITFTDRDGYLEWRRRWRSDYAELAVGIRRMKRVVSRVNSAYARGLAKQAPAMGQRALRHMQEAAEHAMMCRRMSKVLAGHL